MLTAPLSEEFYTFFFCQSEGDLKREKVFWKKNSKK